MMAIATTVLRLCWGMATDIGDTLLVWAHLKHWPATGRAQRNGKHRSDPQAAVWQDKIRHLK
jgi:hypothetical protein